LLHAADTNHRRKSPKYPLDKRLGETQVDRMEKKSFLLPGIQFQPSNTLAIPFILAFGKIDH
jgi:hypothetical protein